MHRHLLVVGAAAAALAVSACNQPADKTEAAAPPDANPAATIPTPADEAAAPDFVAKAGASDMFELAAAKVAETRATDPKVKDFAAMMVKDHTKSTADLKAAIAASGQTTLAPPTSLPADLQAKVDDLSKAEAADFDKAYMDAQVDAHQDALNLLQRYAQDGDVAQIKAFAAATAPVVQGHLDQARTIRDGLK